MDAFTLAFSYGIKNVSKKNIIITALTVGTFHFFMPLLGNLIGVSLFEYSIIKPKIVLFLVFLILSIDMFIHFFDKEPKIRELTILGTLLFSFSVSFDSFSIGIGLNYLYSNLFLSFLIFCLISFIFTVLGFVLGKVLSKKMGKYGFLIGGVILFIYSIWVLT